MHLSLSQNESYIPQLFTRKFSSGEPKCPNGLVVRDWNGQFIFRMNHTYIVVLLLNYSENSPNRGYITIMPFCLSKIVSPRPLLMILQ